MMPPAPPVPQHNDVLEVVEINVEFDAATKIYSSIATADTFMCIWIKTH